MELQFDLQLVLFLLKLELNMGPKTPFSFFLSAPIIIFSSLCFFVPFYLTFSHSSFYTMLIIEHKETMVVLIPKLLLALPSPFKLQKP
jgi:hypothetical protein